MSEPLKLMPCPFCGGAASDYQWLAGCWEVECDNCHISLPDRSRAEALAAWNRRAPAALPTREEMARMLYRRFSWLSEDYAFEITDAILSLLRAKEAEG